MSIANVSIVGNVVKAPQQIQFASGKVKTTLFVAVNTPYREKRGGDSADFYKVETWGKLAELVAGRLAKGNQVTANGRLQIDKWTDDKGRERMTPTISASDVAFPQRPRQSGGADSESSELLSSSAENCANNIDDDEGGESEDPEEDDEQGEDESGGYGEPNTVTRPVPMRKHGTKHRA